MHPALCHFLKDRVFWKGVTKGVQGFSFLQDLDRLCTLRKKTRKMLSDNCCLLVRKTKRSKKQNKERRIIATEKNLRSIDVGPIWWFRDGQEFCKIIHAKMCFGVC